MPLQLRLVFDLWVTQPLGKEIVRGVSWNKRSHGLLFDELVLQRHVMLGVPGCTRNNKQTVLFLPVLGFH